MSGAAPRAAAEGALVDLAWLRERAPAWDRLLERAACPNPCHGRHVIEAHAAAGIAPPRRFAVACRSGELVGLLPLVPGRSRFGLRAALAGWTSPFAPNGTPLLARDDPEAAARGLLAALAAGPALLRLPLAALDHPVAAALKAEAAGLGLPVLERACFGRPVLDRADAWAKPRKAVARRMAQLAALGAVEHRVETGGEGLRQAVEAFLRIEAGGWKGRRGTAMASRPATAALARSLFGEAGAPVSARADLLTLDGVPIAASLALACGGTAHLLKTAYDEAYRRFGPGVMLEDAIVRDLARTGFADRLDSASLPGGVLDAMYPGRERIGELVIGLSPSLAVEDLDRGARIEALIEGAAGRLKALYWAVRSAWAEARGPSSSRHAADTDGRA